MVRHHLSEIRAIIVYVTLQLSRSLLILVHIVLLVNRPSGVVVSNIIAGLGSDGLVSVYETMRVGSHCNRRSTDRAN